MGGGEESGEEDGKDGGKREEEKFHIENFVIDCIVVFSTQWLILVQLCAN